MPDRTPTTQLTVTVEVRDDLNDFIDRLKKQEGVDPTQGQLIAAFVHGMSPAMAAYLVKAYIKHKAKPASGGASAVKPPEKKGRTSARRHSETLSRRGPGAPG